MTARNGPDSPRAVVLGRVGAPFGVQGWVKVTSFTEPASGIADYARWTLVRDDAKREVRVLESKRAGQSVAVRLEGVETREAAQALNGFEVQVDRSELPEPGPKEHYLHDLVGLEAVNRDGVALGQVEGFLDLPAHPVAVLRQGKLERLVPMVPERLVAVDLEAGRLTFDWHPDD
ncbi:MAG TPA: ribosome maturation factor RimM [Steroidobacteraceae bacterium]|nr:ribosome maturation factor RimM [Steroidobacteraceae bacterium]